MSECVREREIERVCVCVNGHRDKLTKMCESERERATLSQESLGGRSRGQG